MSASLIDILNREKALVDQIDRYDDDIKIHEEKIAKLTEEKRSTELKLASIRSCLANYIENNLIKLPNNDPYKTARV